MARIKRLVSTDKLKTTRWKKMAEGKQRPQWFSHYDDEFDALLLLIVPPTVETVVHYIDDHVALVYEHKSREVVGLQIEDFEHSFLPQHAAVERVWRLSDAGVKLEDFGDLTLAVKTLERLRDRLEHDVAREVVEASVPLVSELGIDLEPVLA